MNPSTNPFVNDRAIGQRTIVSVIAGLLMVALIALAVDRLTRVLPTPTPATGWIDPASLTIRSLNPPSHETVSPLPLPLPLPTIEPGKLFMTPAGRSPLLQAGELLEKPMPYHPVAASPQRLSGNIRRSPFASKPVSDTDEASAKTTPSSASPAHSSTDAKVISWQQAAEHIGQTMTVQGKVTQTYFSTKDQLCFLNFASKRQGAFFVIIFQEALGVWGSPPDELFKGKTIRVTGTIFQYQDRTQIRVYEKEQIQIVDPDR